VASAGEVSSDRVARRVPAQVVLLSELFPPATGGSAVLLENVYSRLADLPVTVLTHGATVGVTSRRGPLTIVEQPLDRSDWGLLQPRSLLRHVQAARTLRALSGKTATLVHCARVLPEGLSAFLGAIRGGARYLCWAHGEELAYISTSLELRTLTRLVFSSAAAVIANSENTARLVERSGVPREKITVVYPGVDAERFAPATVESVLRTRLAPKGGLLLLSVGRLQRRKGHDLAIRAVQMLRDEGLGIRYVIAGDGEEKAALQKLAGELGLSDVVLFAGRVPDDELPAYYAACDIFLMPNREEPSDFEGFGIVFLEAAASGKPVIAGRSGGAADAVLEGVTGLLVSGTDAGELAQTIRRLAASMSLRAELGTAGRCRVLERFTWARAASVVRDLHLRLSSNGSVKPEA
jgi:phosphatidylinositol alpha-1,6-mannosyltransferase